MNKSQWQTFWKVLRRRLIFSAGLLVACFIFTQWILPMVYQPSSEFQMMEVADRQIIRLRKNIRDGAIYHLDIKIEGQLNGTALLRVFKSDSLDEVYTEKIIGSGKIKTQLLANDWYADDCRLEYLPITATAGGIKLKYLFKSLKVKGKRSKP